MKNKSIVSIDENDMVLKRKQHKQIIRYFMEDLDDQFKELWYYRKI